MTTLAYFPFQVVRPQPPFQYESFQVLVAFLAQLPCTSVTDLHPREKDRLVLWIFTPGYLLYYSPLEDYILDVVVTILLKTPKD